MSKKKKNKKKGDNYNSIAASLSNPRYRHQMTPTLSEKKKRLERKEKQNKYKEDLQ